MKKSKLGNKSKQRLTTLMVLGAVAGLGYQVDTAHADTPSTGDDADQNTQAGSTANDTSVKQVALTSASDQQGNQQSNQASGETTGSSSAESKSGESQPETVTPGTSDTATDNKVDNTKDQSAGDTGVATNHDVNQDGDTSKGDNGQLTDTTKAAEKTNETAGQVMTSSQATGNQTASKQSPIKAAKMMSVAAFSAPLTRAADTIKTWTSGTCKIEKDTVAHTITIYGGTLGSGYLNPFDLATTKIIFAEPVILSADASHLFGTMQNLAEIDGLENVDASHVTNMNGMFQQTAITSLDLSSWDLSHVTSMESAFAFDRQLTDLKLGTTTGNVKVMSSMLSMTGALTSVDAADWDVHSLELADGLFYGSGLSALDLSKWDTSNITSLSTTLSEMPNLTTVEVGPWQTSKVTDFNQVFENDPLLTAVDVSQWDVSSGVNFTGVFHNDASLKTIDLSHWTPAVNGEITGLTWLVSGDTNLTSLDLSAFDMRGGQVSVNSMLENTTNLKTLKLGPKNNLLGDENGDAYLPDIPVTDVYTGLWQAVGTGTVAKPTGATFTSAELVKNYDGATMADTYVWQKVPTAEPETPTNTGSGTTSSTPTVTVDPAAETPMSAAAAETVATAKTAKSARQAPVTKGGAAATVDETTPAKRSQSTKTATKATTKATVNQTRKQRAVKQTAATILPQTNEQTSDWLAVAAGVVGLSLLGLSWFRRQKN